MLLTVVASIFLLAGPHPAAGAAPAPADSTELLERAREAQVRFERLRRRNLPVTRARRGGTCTEVVGRFCLFFGGEDDWEPSPDPPEVQDARQRLLDTLSEVGARIPGDRWVLAQRIFYLGEEERWSEAMDLAAGCGGQPDAWWCRVLRGFVHHGAERYPAALRAFEGALESMGSERARRWTDPEHILEQGAWERWSDADAEARDRLRRRLWVLSDPLYLVEGNDRLTAHFVRHTVSWIREDAANPHGVSWGWDLTRILVRYGAEVGWERARAPVGRLEARSVVGHHHPESRQFLPSAAAFRTPTELEPAQWTLEEERPRTTYAPPYAARMEVRPFQVARFRRRGDLVVVGGFRLPPDTVEDPSGETPPSPRGRGLQAGLFLVDPDSGVVRQARVRGRTSGGLRLRAEAGAYLVGVEAWDPGRGRAVRARQGVRMPRTPPPDVASISDLLVMEPAEEPPRSLEEAVPRVRPEPRACPGGSMAVGWELYGVGLRRETVAFRLRVERTGRSFLERTGAWLGLVDPSPAVTLEWTEPGPERLRPHFRSVDVTLPPDLEEAPHELTVEVRLPGRAPLTARRRLRIDGERCRGTDGSRRLRPGRPRGRPGGAGTPAGPVR